MLNINDELSFSEYKTEKPFLFSKHSSIGCGGSAFIAVYPQSETELVRVCETLEKKEIPFHVLGYMTNVLPPDGELDSVVVSTKGLNKITTTKNGLYVETGVSAGALLNRCKELGKSGAEFLAGIPCTMGGALYMNAGVQDGHMSDVVESVRVFYRGKILELSLNECDYGYKTSVFMQGGFTILGAKLRFTCKTREVVEGKIKEYLDKRKRLPKGKSMGCVFKNPEGYFAWQLIDGAGLKGLRMGGAYISEEHANFVINDNDATSEQIKKLITVVKNAVFAQYKIRLEEEIRYLD